MRLVLGILFISPFLSGSHFFSENGDLPPRYPYPMSEFVTLYICVVKFEAGREGGGRSCQLVCWASLLSAVKCGPRYSLVTQVPGTAAAGLTWKPI